MPYTVGIDYGTESGRALLVDTMDRREIATAVHPYANDVIDTTLPTTGKKLAYDWALQDPHDYIDVIRVTVPAVLHQSGIDPKQVVGLAIDFTACTMMPAKADGRALRSLPEWQDNPHAWVKLWRHHASQPQADQINAIARQMGEKWLDRYEKMGKLKDEVINPLLANKAVYDQLYAEYKTL